MSWSEQGFTKSSSTAAPGFYQVEAAGLRWLAAAEGGATVVVVLDVDDTSITLDRLTPDGPPDGLPSRSATVSP